MRAKQMPSSILTRSKSPVILLFAVAMLALSFFFFFLFSPSSTTTSAAVTVPYRHPSVRPETSFVASLEHFLAHKAPKIPASSDDTVGSVIDHDVRRLDERKFVKEMEWLRGDPYYPMSMPVRVYVYEMPSKFTYDLLRLFRNTYRETSNLTSNGSPVHRLIEQEALKWVTDQPAWKRSEGRDHIFPIHHPWSFKSVRRYVKNAIWLLPDMDSTGNWYKPGQVSLEKDLILPYVPNVDLCDAKCLLESESKRTTLLFFRGRLKRNAVRGGKIRSKIGAELTGAKDVVIEEGTAGEGGKAAAQKGMRRSIFCLSPAGDTPSSARLFDAIVSGCIPVIISDELELPFEGILDYRKMAVFISSTDAVQPGWILRYLKSISSTQIREMRRNLAEYSRHFVYSNPAQPLGPEDLVWRMMAGKLVNIKLHTRRSQRVVKESRSVCTCDCRRSNSTHSNPIN
ncbi:putative arabinosyltransferase ARAD1 isoform X1 [Gossypium australe]|uniref:Putative arabinosyltransferase ARAD1 isoform X1 n=1 Tax=Gossypium australe TaxID=47621 RepID=A0A5B6VHR3_9ROSI|nr:putative arabinosyltransferase ARAD1 isoform X1 [Gossypium australe]